MAAWQELERERVFSGYGNRGVDRVTFELPSGASSDFDITIEPDTVAVLALTTRGTFLTVRQFRPGPMAELDELPGGVHDKATPLDTIREELRNETGYTPGSVKEIARLPTAAHTARQKWGYVALNCHRVSKQQLEPTEFADVREWSPEPFTRHALSGQMTDTEVALLGLVHLGMLRPCLIV